MTSMNSSCSSQDAHDLDKAENMLKFVNIIKEHAVLFDKSMTPDVRRKKTAATIEVRKKMSDEIGVVLLDNQIAKKIQNMKSRLKKKCDFNQTGNKKIVLKDWEEVLLSVIEADSNPTIVRMKGAVTAGVPDTNPDDDIEEEDDIFEAIDPLPQPSRPRPKPAVQAVKLRRIEETEDTRGMSTTELQRVVLIEQLKYFRKAQEVAELKKEYYLKKLAPKHAEDPDNHEEDCDNDSYMYTVL